MKTLDKALLGTAVVVVLFIITMIVIYTIKDWNMDVLIGSVLGGGLFEAFFTHRITIAKIRKGETDENG